MLLCLGTCVIELLERPGGWKPRIRLTTFWGPPSPHLPPPPAWLGPTPRPAPSRSPPPAPTLPPRLASDEGPRGLGILCTRVVVTQRAGAGRPPPTTPLRPPRRDACSRPIVVARPAPQLQAPPPAPHPPLPPAGLVLTHTAEACTRGCGSVGCVGGGWARRAGAAVPPSRSPPCVCYTGTPTLAVPFWALSVLPAPLPAPSLVLPSCVCCAGASPHPHLV